MSCSSTAMIRSLTRPGTVRLRTCKPRRRRDKSRIDRSRSAACNWDVYPRAVAYPRFRDRRGRTQTRNFGFSRARQCLRKPQSDRASRISSYPESPPLFTSSCGCGSTGFSYTFRMIAPNSSYFRLSAGFCLEARPFITVKA